VRLLSQGSGAMPRRPHVDENALTRKVTLDVFGVADAGYSELGIGLGQARDGDDPAGAPCRCRAATRLATELAEVVSGAWAPG
jgi:hypothetical protein